MEHDSNTQTESGELFEKVEGCTCGLCKCKEAQPEADADDFELPTTTRCGYEICQSCQ